ncbi:MAG: glycosyltransferase family 39 protein, partial [Anaerolineae bacterium]
MRQPHPLLVLGAAFTLLVLLHSGFTPVFEAPDEVWHYAYVRWLSEGHGLPPLNNDLSGAHQEAAQPPLYYTVAAIISRQFSDDDLDEVRWHNPGFGYQAGGTRADNKNMLIHPPEERWPWTGAVLAVHATRLTSWLFGLITVVAAWGLGWETFGRRRAALLTAALVAFQPQFVLLSSVVNNDAAAAALATTGLWLIARTLRRGATYQLAIAGGIVTGLAALTKTSLLLLGPLYAVVLAGVTLTQYRREREKAGSRRLWAILSLYGAVALVVGGGWYLRNAVRYGDPLGLTDHLQTQWGRPEPVPLWDLMPEVPLLLRSFWGAYGWGHVTWPDWLYVVLWGVHLALLAPAVGCILRYLCSLARRRAQPPRRVSTSERLVLTMGLVALAWTLGILTALLRWMQQVEAPHGRLLFPALGAWSLLITLGIR